ncbi:hypothetical protein Tco_0287360 [Tanacetum coccineum]
MRANELYKFLDGTLKKVWGELHHRIRDFRLEYNKEMPRRKWTAIDRKRSKFMVELIDKQMREEGSFEILKDWLSELEESTQTKTELTLEQTQQGVSDEVLVCIKEVEELKRKVKIKGEKKEALLTLRQKPSQYINCRNTKLLSGIKDSRHGPSDVMHNPPHPLKVGKTLVSKLTEITCISIDFLTPRLLILKR